ncbi:MAG: MFS transporter [Candidatus Marinimicrobia bacterium]|nr:MFS transporter [Candidatus Neomarinimicrobiota bacterium]
MNRIEKTILAITGGAHLSVHALMLALPSLIPIFMSEFNVGIDVLGFVVTISAFMFGVGAIPSGWLESKIGGKTLLILYLFGSSFSAILISISNSFNLLVFGLGLLGLTSSIYHPAGLTLISNRIHRITKGMAIHGIFGSTGSAIGPVLATTLALFISWRASYATLGLFNFTLGIASILLIPSTKDTKNVEIMNNKKNAKVTNRIALIFFYITNLIMGFVYYGFTTFMPIHFAENTKEFLPFISDTMKAGVFPSFVFLSGVIGQIIGGKLGTHFNRIRILPYIIAINIPFLLLMGYSRGFLLIFCSLCLGMTYFSSQPICNTIIADLTHTNNRGIGYGINFFLSMGIGSLAAMIGGILAINFGTTIIFISMGFLLIPALITSYFIILKS